MNIAINSLSYQKLEDVKGIFENADINIRYISVIFDNECDRDSFFSSIAKGIKARKINIKSGSESGIKNEYAVNVWTMATTVMFRENKLTGNANDSGTKRIKKFKAEIIKYFNL